MKGKVGPEKFQLELPLEPSVPEALCRQRFPSQTWCPAWHLSGDQLDAMRVPPPGFPPLTAEAEAFPGTCISDEQDISRGPFPLGAVSWRTRAPLGSADGPHPAQAPNFVWGSRRHCRVCARITSSQPPRLQAVQSSTAGSVSVPNSPSLNCFSPLFGSLSALDAFASPPSCRIQIGRTRGACSEPPASLRLLLGFLSGEDGSEVAA